jgi:hypothetical protein
MSVRDFAPGKEVLGPRGAWTSLSQRQKGKPQRASIVENCRFAPGIVRSRDGTTNIATSLGRVTGIFNWIGPDANYALYRDGSILRSLKQGVPTTLQTVLADIGSMLRPSFADLDTRIYIAGYDESGNGTAPVRIFDGTNADTAFRPPFNLLAAGALDTGDGYATEGTHYFGFVYTNRTGYSTAPITTFGGDAISIGLDADKRQVTISVELPALDDGGGASLLSLVATRSDNQFKFYYVPTDSATGSVGSQPVPLSTPTTLTFIFSQADEDMASDDDATDQFQVIQAAADGTPPFIPSFVVAYGQRMVYGWGSKLLISDLRAPQQMAFDLNELVPPNQRKIGYAFPLAGSTDLFFTGDRWTSRVTDNNDSPSTWYPGMTVSDALGAPYPACVCWRTLGSYAFVVCESGPYVFRGTYDDQPLTYLVADIWKRVNWKAAYAIECADNVIDKIFYIAVPLDGATMPTHLLSFDYTNGLTFDNVDISLDSFPRPTFSSIGVVKEYANDESRLWIGPAGGASDTYTFTVQVVDANGDSDTVTCSIDVSCP